MMRKVWKRVDGILVEHSINGVIQPLLGDKIAAIATPIARALKLPCIDPETGELKPESDCAKRRDAINKWTTKI